MQETSPKSQLECVRGLQVLLAYHVPRFAYGFDLTYQMKFHLPVPLSFK